MHFCNYTDIEIIGFLQERNDEIGVLARELDYPEFFRFWEEPGRGIIYVILLRNLESILSKENPRITISYEDLDEFIENEIWWLQYGY